MSGYRFLNSTRRSSPFCTIIFLRFSGEPIFRKNIASQGKECQSQGEDRFQSDTPSFRLQTRIIQQGEDRLENGGFNESERNIGSYLSADRVAQDRGKTNPESLSRCKEEQFGSLR